VAFGNLEWSRTNSGLLSSYISLSSKSLRHLPPPSKLDKMLPILSFFISSYGIYSAYNVVHDYLLASSPEYVILPEARQYYVIKNIIKGYYLAFLVGVSSILILPSVLFFGTYNNLNICVVASLYVSNDFVGLFRVNKLPTTTRLHHTASLLLLVLAWRADFQNNRTAQMLFFYCYLSAWSFCVNLYLGMRFCTKEDPKTLRSFAKISYAICCLLNWTLQCLWFDFTIESYCYVILLLAIVYDDVVLLRWLWR